MIKNFKIHQIRKYFILLYFIRYLIYIKYLEKLSEIEENTTSKITSTEVSQL